MANFPNQANISPNPRPVFMYRPPNRSKHIKLTEALDEIFNRLNEIEGYLKREGAPGNMFPEKRNFFLQLLTRWR